MMPPAGRNKQEWWAILWKMDFNVGSTTVSTKANNIGFLRLLFRVRWKDCLFSVCDWRDFLSANILMQIYYNIRDSTKNLILTTTNSGCLSRTFWILESNGVDKFVSWIKYLFTSFLNYFNLNNLINYNPSCI